MGGDGGSIPKRVDVVRTAGYRFVRNLGGMGYNPNLQARSGDERFGRNESKTFRMSTCALTQEKLKPPIVACRLGNLYNKLPLVEAMVAKKLPSHLSHITSLRTVRELNVSGPSDTLTCPITSSDLTTSTDAVLLWPCGCVMSAKSIENISSDTQSSSKPTPSASESTCLVCGTEYKPDVDVIYIAPDAERRFEMEEALEKWKPSKLTKKGRHPCEENGDRKKRRKEPSEGAIQETRQKTEKQPKEKEPDFSTEK